MWFVVRSKLKVNLEKSEIISVGRMDNIVDLAHEVGDKVGALPSYLVFSWGFF